MTVLRASRLLLAAALISACSDAPPSPGTEQIAATASLASQVVEVSRVPRETAFDGAVEAINQSTVSAQTTGRVVELPFDVGDYVEKDAVIVRITTTEQRARSGGAEAALAEAKARLAEAQLAFDRTKDIYEKRLVAKAQLDKAAADLDAARARAAAAQAALAEAREGLGYTVIRAPYAGIVVARHVQLGETVAPGRQLMTGLSLEHLRVGRRDSAAAHWPPAQAPQGARDPAGRQVGRRGGIAHPAERRSVHAYLPRAGDAAAGRARRVSGNAGEGRFRQRRGRARADSAAVPRAPGRSDRRLCRGCRAAASGCATCASARPAADGRVPVLAGLVAGERRRHRSHRRGHRLQTAAPGASHGSRMSGPDKPRLGISGRVARAFLATEITPLLALAGLLLGLFAVLVTAREEEPQINVTFANVFIPYPGASAREVESLVTTPAEQIVSEIEGVEHVYSASTPGMASLTVRFEVGEPRTDAIVRLYNAFYSNQDWLPANAGVGQPLIKPKGIDDVPIVAGTLWSEDPDVTAADLLRIAHTMETELQRVPGTRDIETLGGPDRVVHVVFDPQRLAGYGLALDDLRRALSSANASADAGRSVDRDREVLVQAGTFLMTPEEVADLVVGVKDSAPVFLQDVATVSEEPDQPDRFVTFGAGPAAATKGIATAGAPPGGHDCRVQEAGRKRGGRRGARSSSASSRCAVSTSPMACRQPLRATTA